MITSKTEYIKSDNIEGVIVKKLKLIPDERGRLMEILRNDDFFFEKFGQVYMTSTYPQIVKGFHWHYKQTDNICCIHGMIKLVLFDKRDSSSTKGNLAEFFIGTHNPCLITVPTDVIHGWKCISEQEALIINIPSEPYNYEHPDEERVSPHDEDEQIRKLTYSIPYNWHDDIDG